MKSNWDSLGKISFIRASSFELSPESNETFDEFYDNEDNNIITFRDKNYSGCFMEVKPEREDLEVVEYVFMGNPEV